MAEQITLSVPVGPTTSMWMIKNIHMGRGLTSEAGAVVLDPQHSFIEVVLIGENGRMFTHVWRGASADADILALNKVNLTSTSLQKRIFNKLIADGVIAGTLSGTPD